MRPSRSTLFLLGLVAVLALLVALDRRGPEQPVLPVLPALDALQVDRLEFTQQGRKLVLERQEGRWRILQPLQADADRASVLSLLRVYRHELPVDALVDHGHLEDYGLDADEGVVFEAFAQGEKLLSIVVGHDLPGGATLLRLPGSDAVYRARIGGRFRYARSPEDWRNRMVLELEDERVARIAIQRGDQRLSFTREVPDEPDAEPGAWLLAEDPDFPVDQQELDQLAAALAHLRASAVHAPDRGQGWDRPPARVEVATPDEEHELVFVREGTAALVRADERPEVYRVSGRHLERLLAPLEQFRDRQLFSFRRDDVLSIALQLEGERYRAEHDPVNHSWTLVEPVHMELDVFKGNKAASTLGSLRADRVVEGKDPREAGFAPPTWRLEIELRGGAVLHLEVGDAFEDGGQRYRYLRRPPRRTLYAIRESALRPISLLFAQSPPR